MTSPVDTSVKFFNSAMVNAPVLSGSAGALVALLDACLKDGFDTKTLTSMTVSGGVATAAFSGAHSSVAESVVLIAGVSGGPSGFANLNGEQKITGRPSGTTATFATALPDGTYTGTMSIKMAGGGWTTPFTGTNKRVYQGGDPAALGHSLRVDDTGAQTARALAYVNMSDIDTGTGMAPTGVQFSGGVYWRKSDAASAAARPWSLYCDGRAFYLAVTSSEFYLATASMFGFGDFNSDKSGDAYACLIAGSVLSSPSPSSTSERGCLGYGNADQPSDSLEGIFGMRSDTGVGSSVQLRKVGAMNMGAAYSGESAYTGLGSTGIGFPNRSDGTLRVGEIELIEGATIRGRVAGLLHTPQVIGAALGQGDLIPGSGVFAGKKLMAQMVGPSATSSSGRVFVDVSGPWRG